MKARLSILTSFLFIMASVLAFAVSGAHAAKAQATELLVAVPASLTGAFESFKADFEKKNPEIKLLMTAGSTGHLAQQIEQGAPIDVFISASFDITKSTADKGLLDRKTVSDIAYNRLVLAVPADDGKGPKNPLKDWMGLKGTGIRRIAVGNPDHVPAGQYAKGVLQKLGIWDELKPKMVLGEDVTQVLTYVMSGEVDAGIVYSTDAMASGGKVRVAAKAPKDSEAIVYSAAVVKATTHFTQADAFRRYLTGDPAKAVLKRLGFMMADD